MGRCPSRPSTSPELQVGFKSVWSIFLLAKHSNRRKKRRTDRLLSSSEMEVRSGNSESFLPPVKKPPMSSSAASRIRDTSCSRTWMRKEKTCRRCCCCCFISLSWNSRLVVPCISLHPCSLSFLLRQNRASHKKKTEHLLLTRGRKEVLHMARREILQGRRDTYTSTPCKIDMGVFIFIYSSWSRKHLVQVYVYNISISRVMHWWGYRTKSLWSTQS